MYDTLLDTPIRFRVGLRDLIWTPRLESESCATNAALADRRCCSIPFGVYLLAEHIHASGILAAVSAGVTMSYAEISRQALAVTRMRRNSVWDTIQFAANGIIVVLLGEQLPEILSGLDHTVAITGHASPWWLALYVAAIMTGLAMLRFLWLWISLRITVLRRSEEGHGPSSPLGDWLRQCHLQGCAKRSRWRAC